MDTKWYKIEDLQKLEKNCNIDIAYCEIIADCCNDTDLTRQRVLKQDNKYYYHKMQKGQVVNCFEIALHRDISYFADDVDLCCEFWFTSDNLHIIELRISTTRNALEQIENSSFDFKMKHLDEKQIENGMQIIYKDFVITYIDENHIKFDDKIVFVENDYNYIYKVYKTKIKARNGAKGLFVFFDEEFFENWHNDFAAYNAGYCCHLLRFRKLYKEYDGNITEFKKSLK